MDNTSQQYYEGGNYGNRDPNEQQLQQQKQQQQQQLDFSTTSLTAEDRRVLKECNRESMLYRCIPLCSVFSIGTYYAIKTGYWKPSPTLGFFPKIGGALFAGYLLGKMSYQKVCADRLMELPDSKIGAAIRMRRGVTLPSEMTNLDSGLSSPADEVFNTIPATPIFDDHKPDERDRSEGLEDYNKVADSLSEYALPLADSEPPVSTYDDRRKLNRAGYERAAENPRINQSVIMPDAPPPPPGAPYSPVLSAGRKNKYGDIILE